jgi:hypothetical protein
VKTKLKFLLASLLVIAAFAVFKPEVFQRADFMIGATLMLGVCVSVDDIDEEDDCGPNAGGMTDFYIARRSDILSIPAVGADGVTISTDIVMKSGKKFAKWSNEIDFHDLNWKTEGDAGSQTITQELNIYISRFKAATDKEFNNAINGKFIVISVDPNGTKRIGGNLLRPLTLNFDAKSGKKNTDKKGTDIKATAGTGHVPFYYTGVIPIVAAA